MHPFPKQMLFGFLSIVASFLLGCKKEDALEQSKLDVNYYVNHDSSTDPVDQAIYQFYTKTGIAGFYNDTIATVKISKEEEPTPRYKHITIKLEYQLTGNSSLAIEKINSTAFIPDVLEILETLVLPQLPQGFFIPCFYFIDDYQDDQFIKFKTSQGRSSYFGFDGVGIVVRDVAAMNMDERKTYAASILAGLAFKKIATQEATALKDDFFSISRISPVGPNAVDAYIGLPYMLVGYSDSPIPETLGFLSHFIFPFLGVMELESLPTENADLRNFLAIGMRYNLSELESLYASYPKVLAKFSVIRTLLTKAGFKLPN